MAEAGHAVTGVDLDPAMLDRARNRASGTAAEDRLTLVEADIVGLRLPDAGRFGLAFIALNSLLVLSIWTVQRAAVPRQRVWRSAMECRVRRAGKK